MDFHVQLKVFNKTTIPTNQMEYEVENKTLGTTKKDKLDETGCTKLHICNQFDLIYIWILFSGKRHKFIRVFPQTENKYIQRIIINITSGQPSMGGSIKPVPVLTNGRRKLTDNEITLGKSIFKSSIDYSKVYIHDSSWFPFDLQAEDTAVTPNGEIYFPNKNYKPDFVLPNSKDIKWRFDAHWFIHELAHVWQFQLGFPVKTQGIIDMKNRRIASHDAYTYVLRGKTDLNEFIMEAQADILADYCMYINGLHKGLNYTTWPERIQKEIKIHGDIRYHAVLKRFLNNPKDKTLLPVKMDVIENENSPNYLQQYFSLM